MKNRVIFGTPKNGNSIEICNAVDDWIIKLPFWSEATLSFWFHFDQRSIQRVPYFIVNTKLPFLWRANRAIVNDKIVIMKINKLFVHYLTMCCNNLRNNTLSDIDSMTFEKSSENKDNNFLLKVLIFLFLILSSV